MLTLYGFLRSGNVYKVRLLLAQIGIPHRRVEVSQLTGDTSRPAFRAINPIGKVPTLVFDDGKVLSESGAHPALSGGGHSVLAGGPVATGAGAALDVLRAVQPRAGVAVNWFLCVYTGADDRASQIETNHRRGTHALAVMDDHLARNEWFGVPRYSIADIALYAYTHVADEGGFDLRSFRHIGRWLERVCDQPGHIRLLQETSAEPVVNLDGVPVSPASAA